MWQEKMLDILMNYKLQYQLCHTYDQILWTWTQNEGIIEQISEFYTPVKFLCVNQFNILPHNITSLEVTRQTLLTYMAY